VSSTISAKNKKKNLVLKVNMSVMVWDNVVAVNKKDKTVKSKGEIV